MPLSLKDRENISQVHIQRWFPDFIEKYQLKKFVMTTDDCSIRVPQPS